MAPTHTPDPIRLTTRDPDPNRPTRVTSGGFSKRGGGGVISEGSVFRGVISGHHRRASEVH